MFRRIALYFSIAAVLVVAIALVASGVFLKKPAKPVITPVPIAVTPTATEEKVPSPPVEAPPAVEQKATFAAPVEVSPIVEKAPLITEAPPAEKALKYEFHKGMIYVAWTGNGYSNVN